MEGSCTRGLNGGCRNQRWKQQRPLQWRQRAQHAGMTESAMPFAALERQRLVWRCGR